MKVHPMNANFTSSNSSNSPRQSSHLGASAEPAKSYLFLEPDSAEAHTFDCDATAAMTYLGIKRSRLTQISGRELPCARIKVDRYTRPMYRWTDVKSYHESTKTTVSYAKSQQLFETTIHTLTHQINELNAIIQQLSTQLHRCEQQLQTQAYQVDGLVNQLQAFHHRPHPRYPSCSGTSSYQAGSKYHHGSPNYRLTLAHKWISSSNN